MKFTRLNLFGLGNQISYAIASILFFIVLTSNSFSQVTFTQTSDADFTSGYLDNVMVSGNNVYLATKATDVNNWLSTTDLPQTLSGHQTARWKNSTTINYSKNVEQFLKFYLYLPRIKKNHFIL